MKYFEIKKKSVKRKGDWGLGVSLQKFVAAPPPRNDGFFTVHFRSLDFLQIYVFTTLANGCWLIADGH